MSRPIKIVLYAVCITMVIVFGLKAKQEFGKAANARQLRQQRLDDAANIENTNVVERTNLLAENTNSLIDTNLAGADSTNLALTNQTIAVTAAPQPSARPSYSRMITYL